MKLHKLMQGVLHPAAEGAVLALLVVFVAKHGFPAEFWFVGALLSYGCLLYQANEDPVVIEAFRNAGWWHFTGDLIAVSLRVFSGTTLLERGSVWVAAVSAWGNPIFAPTSASHVQANPIDWNWCVALIALAPISVYHVMINIKDVLGDRYVLLALLRTLLLLGGCALLLFVPGSTDETKILIVVLFAGLTAWYGKELLTK